jgi:hypothetical protein
MTLRYVHDYPHPADRRFRERQAYVLRIVSDSGHLAGPRLAIEERQQTALAEPGLRGPGRGRVVAALRRVAAAVRLRAPLRAHPSDFPRIRCLKGWASSAGHAMRRGAADSLVP